MLKEGGQAGNAREEDIEPSAPQAGGCVAVYSEIADQFYEIDNETHRVHLVRS